MLTIVHAFLGVRYYMRGIDDEGHAANYCETEQIVVYRQKMTSFVQVCITLMISVHCSVV